MNSTTKEAFSVREFCARYSICRDSFYREIRRGRLKAVKLGTKTMVLKVEADSWAASLPALQLKAGERSGYPGRHPKLPLSRHRQRETA
jgi:hypothetical protein